MSDNLGILLAKAKRKKIEKEKANKTSLDIDGKTFDLNIGDNDAKKIAKYIPKKFDIGNIKDFLSLIPKQKDFPKEIKVSNLSKIPKTVIPKSIGINNFSQISKYFPKKIEISNFDKFSIEFPKNLKNLSFDTTERILFSISKNIASFTKKISDGIFIKNKDPKEAIPVRMVDKAGKEFTEMKHTFVGPSIMKLKNAENPATFEGQESIVDAIENITIPITEGEAIEAKQEIFGGYELASFDITSNPIYIGSMDKDGKWVIKKIDTNAGDAQYAIGDSNFSTNWEGKLSLEYNSIDNIL